VSRLVKLSEAASLGLHTMALLARNADRRLTNQEIADVLEGSGHHLAKVTQRLVRSGLLSSARGPQGGFLLGRPAENITLLEIFEAIEGPIDEQGCLLGDAACEEKDCNLGGVMRSIHAQIRDYMKNTLLSELALGYRFQIPAPAAGDRAEKSKP